MAFSLVKDVLNVQYGEHFDKVREFVVWQEQGKDGSHIELVDSEGRQIGLRGEARLT